MSMRPAPGGVLQRLIGEPAAVELVLYHDVLCSWCYVADARLDYLRDEYGATVRWRMRPYPLRPDNQLPDKKQRAVLARHFRRVAREDEGKGVKADLIEAYMWTALAGSEKHTEAPDYLQQLTSRMTEHEIAEAQARVRQWIQKHSLDPEKNIDNIVYKPQ